MMKVHGSVRTFIILQMIVRELLDFVYVLTIRRVEVGRTMGFYMCKVMDEIYGITKFILNSLN